VPVDLAAIVSAPARWPGQAGDYPERPARLVWTGRFEHDKGGDSLWHTLVELERVGLEYELAVTGQQFRTVPAVFGRIEKAFSHRLVQFGYIPSALSYRALLRGADMVLSTAMHEFQGLAVLEAVAAGCLPAVPDRQAYPEIYPSQFRYDSHPDDPALDGRAAAGLLCRLAAGMEQPGLQPPDVGAFDPGRLRLAYAALLETLPAAAG
jgi:glycosyltransferase involved in cell wall biosynthesis